MCLLRSCWVAVLTGLVLAGPAGAADEAIAPPAPPRVLTLSLDGAVSPASADYLVRGLRQAAREKADLVVIRIDTPGGLDTAMRDIIREIIASPVPVASHVAPGGARAASAGTYILYASHVAAMAPGTNLGAATPVAIGLPGQPGPPAPAGGAEKGGAEKDAGADKSGKAAPATSDDPMKAKQVNDASAYIRGLAQLRGRNAEWAEQAVRDAVSLSAEEALKLQVVDLVAADLPALLDKLDGRKVTVQGVERQLSTTNAQVQALEPDWRSRVLAVIANPGVALILMMIGIYGLIFEFANPGSVAPGVVGGICLLLAGFAFQLLPVNYAGLGLILLGLGFIIAEAFVPSFGILGLGGAAALTLGAVLLFDADVPGIEALPTPFIATLGVLSSALVFATVTLALKARARPVVSGAEELIGAPGTAMDEFEGEGWVWVAGERWRARASGRLARGQALRVRSRTGLTLLVEPADEGGKEQ